MGVPPETVSTLPSFSKPGVEGESPAGTGDRSHNCGITEAVARGNIEKVCMRRKRRRVVREVTPGRESIFKRCWD